MNDKQLEYFYSMVSFAGLLSLYTFKLSFDKKVAFDKNDLTAELSILPEPYFHGFIVACSAMNIVGYNFKNSIFTVVYLDPMILSTLEDQVKKSAKKEKYWEEELEKVIKYFE